MRVVQVEGELAHGGECAIDRRSRLNAGGRGIVRSPEVKPAESRIVVAIRDLVPDPLQHALHPFALEHIEALCIRNRRQACEQSDAGRGKAQCEQLSTGGSSHARRSCLVSTNLGAAPSLSSWLWRSWVTPLFIATAWGTTSTAIASQPSTTSYRDSASVPVLIDRFESIAGWKTTAADGVTLKIAQDAGLHGNAMRVDFDFHGHGGYAIVGKDFDIALPANYGISFAIRGDAPVNTLEFKLLDKAGNLWWSNQRDFDFPREWKTVMRKKRHFTFAWGPQGGGDIKRVSAIEFTISAGTGGRGTVWIDDLTLTPLDPGPYTLTPRLSASSSERGHPASFAMDGREVTGWRSAPAASPTQSLDIDFLKPREIGTMIIDWEPGRRPSAYTVSGSIGGSAMQTLYTVEHGGTASREYLYLPESDARYLRLSFPPGASPVGVREIKIEPWTWSTSWNDFYAAIARDALPGSYPKYFSGEQSYWTVLGVDGDTREGLLNEQGMIETGKGEFSLEPFLFTSGRLITWRDATMSVGSIAGDLPIKTVTWKIPGLSMDVTIFAAGAPEASLLYARYRLRNPAGTHRRATLYVAIRPFAVNPPWQGVGGVARIDSISFAGRAVSVNADRRVIPLQAPSAFGAMSSDEGNIVDLLRRQRVPTSRAVHDRFGHAAAVLAYDLDLAPRGEATIDVAIPLHGAAPPPGLQLTNRGQPSLWLTEQLAQATADWQRKLNLVGIELPPTASRITETIRANLAYILINRDGPGLQPGSRAYERSWIRDGSLTSTALLRLGHYGEVRDFIDWYSKFQFDSGKIPCCVDSRGADPVPENDSHGEFIYLVAEYYRHTGDRALVERVWPNIARAVAFMDSLRRSRMTPEYRQSEKRAFYGLLPQSISHEGYQQPMHSYWDDFFALRGFKDAVELAHVLSKPEAARYAVARDEFRRDLYASIRLAMSQRGIDYIPGSVELGDFDATSTTIAVAPVGELANLPQAALNRTFDKYYENFLARRDGKIKWDSYVPYELRVVGTFVQMGDKTRAHESLDFFFHDQRPKEWRQWAEVVWRDPRRPSFIGDMPHTWVGSDYIRSVLDMLAYERESDSSLVIGAGIPESWVRRAPGVQIRDLSTHYGRLSYGMLGAGDSVSIHVEGPRVPPGGLVIRSPLDQPIRSATLDGTAIASSAKEVVIRKLPASLVLRY